MPGDAALPVVDYRSLRQDRAGFLRDIRRALADVGFIVLANAPGLDAGFQRRTFREVRRFFDAPAPVKDTASIRLTPHYRGHYPPVQTASQLVETFTYGMEAPAAARHDDDRVPQWKRIFYGPNTWPDRSALPGFRPAVEALRAAYTELHHELGHLICESLGADPARYDDLFDPGDLRLAAFLSHGFGLSHIEQGGVATNRGAVGGAEGRRRVAAELQKKLGGGAHIDITPFMTFITMDTPGLQVLVGKDQWVDVCCPGSVLVQVGSTLQHLSGGRMVASIHRVNTALIPPGRTRVSLPFFLLPRFTGTLVPFDCSPGSVPAAGAGGGTEYATEDRGMMAAHNRMALFPSCTRRWWSAEFDRIKHRARRAERVEGRVAFKKVLARGRGARAAL